MKRRNFILAALVSLFTAPACKSKPKKIVRPYFAGREINLTKADIEALRARAKEIPLTFDIAEVIIKYEGKEKWMTYEEFLVRTGMI